MVHLTGYLDYCPLLFKFVLEYTIGRIQLDQDGLKLNGTRQLFVHADDVNALGGSLHTTTETQNL
jgi:hypothetical protein